MTNFDLEKLYNLLPAVYRVRDAELQSADGEPPLRALLAILAGEVEHLEEGLDQLYDDQFIETCAEWVIPYLGDLIGHQPLAPITDPKFTARSEVANTIGYRRRKGTLSIIEQLARDVTNWDANVVEYFQLLATTQYLNHLRPENLSIPDLRNREQLEYVETPFDTIPRSADVRNIRSRRGKYNIPNIGIYLWRVSANPRTRSNAFSVDDNKFTFHPFGCDSQLFHQPIQETAISALANPENMPVPLKRKRVKYHLSHHYGAGKDFVIRIGENDWLDESQICIGDLSLWEDPALEPPSNKVAVDPEMGRIMFGSGFADSLMEEENIYVSYFYGSAASIGGGEYERISTFTDISKIISVSQDGSTDHSSIQDAINEMTSESTNGVIEIRDSKTYSEKLDVMLNAGQVIEIRGAQGDCPAILLTADFEIAGESLSELHLSGLMLNGGNILVQADAEMALLKIDHCTIKPHISDNKIVLNSAISLQIKNSIVSGIQTFSEAAVDVDNSIIDVTDSEENAISGSEENRGSFTCKKSTVRGRVEVKQISLVENSIFTSKISAQIVQSGCVRFTYLPLESVTPRKFNCYPENKKSAKRIAPTFVSTEYGSSAYFQLDLQCAEELLRGADDDSEIGVYHDLFQPQKESNLRIRLNEYLRFGMEAGIFYAS